MELERGTRRLIARLVLGYCLVAGLWIVVSDQLLGLFDQVAEMTYLATVKGLVFVLFSSLFLFLALTLVARQRAHGGLLAVDSGLADSAIAAPLGPLQGYAFALLLTAATFLLRLAIELPMARPMLIMFMLPIALSALLGGAGPGLLATALPVAGEGLVLLFGYVPTVADQRLLGFQMFVLVASGVVVSLVSRALHRSRQHAELALRRERDARDEYRILSEQLRDPIWRKDREGRYLDCNQPFLNLIHLPRERVLGHTDEELFEAAVAAEWREEDQRVLDTLEAVELEEYWPAPSTVGWVLVSKSPVLDAAGNCVGSIGIARDINRRRIAEQSLKESEALFRTLFEIGQDALLIGAINRDGSDGGFIESNAEALRLFGYARETLLRMTLRELLDDDARDLPDSLRDEVAVSGQAQCVTRARAADGRCFAVELSIIRFEKRGAGEFGVMLAVRDISARLASAAEQARLHDQVAQMQKLEAIGQLTSGIAHDFNNLLATVLGYTELAHLNVAGRDDAKLERYLEAVRTAALRGRDLVSKMLMFSRGRAVAAGDTPSFTAPREVLQSTLELLRSAIPSSIDMDVQLQEIASAVPCDAVEIEQLLMNLAINARDAIDGAGRIVVALGEVSVARDTCSACLSTYAGDFVELMVSDTGSGINVELLPNIFHPFFTTKEVGKGTGLGLALVHGIVHKAGGHIQVDNGVGGGTVVRVRLPRVTPEPLSATAAASPRSATVSAASMAGKHVMVVDDELPLGRYWHALLESEGYRVSVFNDGRSALDAFQAAPQDVDAVLSDLTMPQLSGDELARAMLAERAELPVFLLSGNLAAFDSEAGASLGVRKCFRKPADSAEVLAALQAALQGSNTTRAVNPASA